MDNNIYSPATAQSNEILNLVSQLDSVEMDAIMALTVCLVKGESSESALKACNEILATNGRKPLPYPPEASTALSSARELREVIAR